MKKFIVLLLIFGLLAGIFGTAHAASDQTASVGCHSLQARVALAGSDKKLETAKAAILYELSTDTLVYSYHADDLLDPTGMVKLLTALVALEEGDLDAQVTVSRQALDSVAIGAVSAGLKRGEVLALRDLLYCIMVASANDAAAVVAEFIGGTQQEFVNKMNAKAKELGCSSSHFTNPHGLPDPNQYSTARDLAIITEAALDNPQFQAMFSAREYVVPATEKSDARQLYTTNHMMSSATIKNYVDDRVTGGKPAAATTADRSLICTAQVGAANYLCVVMSAQAQVSEDGISVISFGSFEETKALLDFGFRNYAVRQVIDDSQVFNQYGVDGGENDVILQPSQDLFTVLPTDYDPELLVFHSTVQENLLKAPLGKGDVLGSVQVIYGTVALGSCDLVAMYAVAPKGSTIRPAEWIAPQEAAGPDLTFLIWIGVGILGVGVLAGAIFVGIRMARSARIRRAHRRRMRERRRSR